MANSYTEGEMLKFIASHPVEASKCIDADGMMNLAQVQAIMMLEERKKLLEQHPFEIGFHRKKGLYYTYFLDPSKKSGRKQICRKNRSDLEDLIIEQVKEGQAHSIREVFEEVVKSKLEQGAKQATIDRYQRVFDRHFVEIENMDIRTTDAEMFTDFLERESARCKLTAKGLAALKGQLKSILRRAKRNHWINFGFSEVFDDADIRTVKKHIEDKNQIFTQEEFAKLKHYLVSHPDTTNLAIWFMATTGIRNGELVGLKFDDFEEDGRSFVIRRAETRYKTEQGYRYEISLPKTEAAHRRVFVHKDCLWIVPELRKLNPFAEYLCTNRRGERMTTNVIRERLYRICEKMGFDMIKSPHKLRKTYATIMDNAGCSSTFKTSQMGHEDETTTNRFYVFDRQTDEEKMQVLDNIVEFSVAI